MADRKSPEAKSDAKPAPEPTSGAKAGNVVSLRKPKKTPSPPTETAAPVEAAPDAPADTLFERLGGDGAVEAAVDIFYAKLLSDETLKPFFEGIDMDKQSFMQRIFLTGAFGGPQAYTGRSLRAAHERLVTEKGLGEAHFAAVAGHLQATLEELGVAPDLIREVLTIVAGTKDDVLNL